MYLVHRGACIAASLKLDSSHVPISGFRKARQLPRSDLASGKLDSSHTPIWLQASTRSASTLSLPACFAAYTPESARSNRPSTPSPTRQLAIPKLAVTIPTSSIGSLRNACHNSRATLNAWLPLRCWTRCCWTCTASRNWRRPRFSNSNKDQMWELSSFSEAAIGSPRCTWCTAAPASQPR